MHQIIKMLEACNTETSFFPPTELYNEGWLLRLVLHWFSTNKVENHPLIFSNNAKWFSEALLPSAFLPRSRKDPLGESWTHADGVIGHFDIGLDGKGDLSLKPNAKQFIVLEAKMYSKLSSGVTHARYYDQAARNVACIAEVLRRANRRPHELDSLAFHVLAPESQIKSGVFDKNMTLESIHDKVQRRVSEYHGEKDRWFRDWFLPLMENIKISCLSWEKIIELITVQDSSGGNGVKEFYNLCCKYNSLKER